MTGFLARLAARSLGAEPALRPVVGSRFEPRWATPAVAPARPESEGAPSGDPGSRRGAGRRPRRPAAPAPPPAEPRAPAPPGELVPAGPLAPAEGGMSVARRAPDIGPPGAAGPRGGGTAQGAPVAGPGRSAGPVREGVAGRARPVRDAEVGVVARSAAGGKAPAHAGAASPPGRAPRTEPLSPVTATPRTPPPAAPQDVAERHGGEPVVEVTIGRLEVRAVAPAPPGATARPRAPHRPAAPKLPLDAYLRREAERRT